MFTSVPVGSCPRSYLFANKTARIGVYTAPKCITKAIRHLLHWSFSYFLHKTCIWSSNTTQFLAPYTHRDKQYLTRLNDMTQKYRTTIRETQNLNSWSVGLGPAFILSTTWWTWVRKHWSAFLIKALRYNYQFCSRWIITELAGGHRASKSGSTDSRQNVLRVQQGEVNGTMRATVSYYIYSFAYHQLILRADIYNSDGT